MNIPAGLIGENVSETIVNRFSSKFSIEPDSGCWVWTGHLNNKGYGMIARGIDSSGPILAHRLSYMIHIGKILPGECICHKCDNPKCVNPEHLWKGSQMDNVADMLDKGRYGSSPRKRYRGESHVLSKLTYEAVAEIRGTTIPQRILAKKYWVSQTSVCRVRKFISWPIILP